MHCCWNEGGHHHNMRFGMLIAFRVVCICRQIKWKRLHQLFRSACTGEMCGVTDSARAHSSRCMTAERLFHSSKTSPSCYFDEFKIRGKKDPFEITLLAIMFAQKLSAKEFLDMIIWSFPFNVPPTVMISLPSRIIDIFCVWLTSCSKTAILFMQTIEFSHHDEHTVSQWKNNNDKNYVFHGRLLMRWYSLEPILWDVVASAEPACKTY